MRISIAKKCCFGRLKGTKWFQNWKFDKRELSLFGYRKPWEFNPQGEEKLQRCGRKTAIHKYSNTSLQLIDIFIILTSSLVFNSFVTILSTIFIRKSILCDFTCSQQTISLTWGIFYSPTEQERERNESTRKEETLVFSKTFLLFMEIRFSVFSSDCDFSSARSEWMWVRCPVEWQTGKAKKQQRFSQFLACFKSIFSLLFISFHAKNSFLLRLRHIFALQRDIEKIRFSIKLICSYVGGVRSADGKHGKVSSLSSKHDLFFLVTGRQHDDDDDVNNPI